MGGYSSCFGSPWTLNAFQYNRFFLGNLIACWCVIDIFVLIGLSLRQIIVCGCGALEMREEFFSAYICFICVGMCVCPSIGRKNKTPGSIFNLCTMYRLFIVPQNRCIGWTEVSLPGGTFDVHYRAFLTLHI